MPSPFSGMDPYLEDLLLWPSFQQGFIACLHEELQPGLAAQYQTKVCERRYDAQGELREEYIEIRRRSDDQLVTLLEVVSPANKTTAAGRAAYLNTRQQASAVGSSLVEIDLVLQGQPTLEYSRDNLPQWDYAVTVTRAWYRERFEIYTTTLQKRLPRFRLPLAATERDMVLDLQSSFTLCYDRFGFGERIDYQNGPPPSLHERIALAAYSLWEQEGYPHGRDKEHWHRAVEQLKQQPQTVPS